MKIRKHANISQLVYAAPLSSLQASIILQPHVCQLNQSPWDLSPPPSPPPYSPPSQVKGSGSSAENGSSGGCISATQRKFNAYRLSEFHEAMEVEENHAPMSLLPLNKEKVVMCNKNDGKGRECRREASPPRHVRPKKAPSSNLNEFYYYSGFGPRWGKKRGETSRNNKCGNEIRQLTNEIYVEDDSDNMEYDDEDEEEEVGKKRVRKPVKAKTLKSVM